MIAWVAAVVVAWADERPTGVDCDYGDTDLEETMTVEELLALFEQGRRRCHLVGGEAAGCVVGLDLEGRLFAVLEGEVLNRVNPEAFARPSTMAEYVNPGGDGLWPAPEGSRLGYEYSTPEWRVPPGLTGARYRVERATDNAALVRAEIDLINASGLGVPTAFERDVTVRSEGGALVLTVTECIEYLGRGPLTASECLLAPWSLAQFDCGSGCAVRFPAAGNAAPWDLYDPSDEQRALRDGVWHTRTDATGPRYQIGIGEGVDWLEYCDPRRGLRVRRTSGALPAGQAYIDIADRPPDANPAGPGVRFSVYSDPSGFMEVEAAGGCPAVIEPGARMPLVTTTTYSVE